MPNNSDMKKSLVASSTVPLYDPVCMLDINREVASGYLILLMGGPETTLSAQKKRRGKRDRSLTSSVTDIHLEDNVVNLSFLALTDGNVLNACFGAPTQLCATASPSYRMAQNAKSALAAAADSSDAVRKLAVQSYVAAFRVIVYYNEKVEGMSVCTRCFKQAKLHEQAEQDLKVAFRSLSEAVDAAT